MSFDFLLLSSLILIAYILTVLFIKLSKKINIIDIPVERSSHTVPTPRGGGIAMVITWYLGITVLYFFGHFEKHIFLALLSGIGLAAISFLDDMKDIKPSLRLFIQAISVILALFILNKIKPTPIETDFYSQIIFWPFIVIGGVWFINLYNFLDGIDGYASLEAICLSAGFFILTGDNINGVLFASVIGFLIWNWPKARIFMGDVGSTQLGFILFVLGVYYHIESTISFFIWIILTAPFWFDASFTLFRRWLNKEKLSQAHRKHIYQRLVQSGFSHLKVDILLVILNSILIIAVYSFLKMQWSMIPLILLVLIILFLIALYSEKRMPFPKNETNR